VNLVRKGSVIIMDNALEKAGEGYGLEWDRSKDWGNGVHLKG